MTQLSLAGWSLARRFFKKEQPFLDLLDFPKIARSEFGFTAIELNSPFFAETTPRYLAKLRSAAADQGVKMLNIAVDRTGNPSSSDPEQRRKSYEMNRVWFDVAAELGCNAIRVNTDDRSEPVDDALQARCAETFGQMVAYGKQVGVKLLIENHGGLSGYPERIVQLIQQVNSPWLRTLPDFGNFADAIRYEGLAKIAPYAHAVHAKMYEFDAKGEETKIDIKRCLEIIRAADYQGAYGIEYEGKGDAHDGVLAAKALMEKYLA